ncbi:hypothetical protein FISHEDRAFT_58326 [Fistulina hepatica ATCC 64428]|nr:hypothetical protein FISHEDRAFT_58326 [Fistulina hepatica ATCC 64428]
MTEYNYSPDARERYMRTQTRIDDWVSETDRHSSSFSSPFGSPTSSNAGPLPVFVPNSHLHSPTHASGQSVPTVVRSPTMGTQPHIVVAAPTSAHSTQRTLMMPPSQAVASTSGTSVVTSNVHTIRTAAGTATVIVPPAHQSHSPSVQTGAVVSPGIAVPPAMVSPGTVVSPRTAGSASPPFPPGSIVVPAGTVLTTGTILAANSAIPPGTVVAQLPNGAMQVVQSAQSNTSSVHSSSVHSTSLPSSPMPGQSIYVPAPTVMAPSQVPVGATHVPTHIPTHVPSHGPSYAASQVPPHTPSVVLHAPGQPFVPPSQSVVLPPQSVSGAISRGLSAVPSHVVSIARSAVSHLSHGSVALHDPHRSHHSSSSLGSSSSHGSSGSHHSSHYSSGSGSHHSSGSSRHSSSGTSHGSRSRHESLESHNRSQHSSEHKARRVKQQQIIQLPPNATLITKDFIVVPTNQIVYMGNKKNGYKRVA